MIDWEAFYAYDRALAECAWISRTATNMLVAGLAGVDGEAFAKMHVDGVIAGNGFGLDAEALLGADVSGLVAMNDEEFEQALKSVLPRIVDVYGDVAAQTALEFYKNQRVSHSPDSDYEPTLAERIPERFIIDDIDKELATVRKYATESGFASYLELHGYQIANNLAAHVQKLVMKSADETILHNVRRDPANPRWAFVARAGACGWCVMVSSNGWRYRSEASAMRQRHLNCKCPVVADFDTDNPYLEGYDPSWMRQAYANCVETVSDEVDRRWAAMTDEEKSQYKGKWEFKRNMVVAEMNRRDREWLRTGASPGVAKTLISDEEWNGIRQHEKDAWIDLANKHGIAPDLLPEDSDKANIDAWYQGSFWELKSPGDGKHSLENMVYEAVTKWKRLECDGPMKLIVSNSRSSRPDSDVLEEAIRRCRRYGVSELLFLSHDGERLVRTSFNQ